MWYLIDQAPQGFNIGFLEWLRITEDSLSTSFADWYPSDVETQEVKQLIQWIGQEVPTDLQIYYMCAYPFDRVKNGVSLWAERIERFMSVWMERQRPENWAAERENSLPSPIPVLWPVDCFHRYDTVAFLTEENELAVIHVDSLSAKATPVALGLRNYFLTQVALQILAHELNVEPNWNRLCSHPTIALLSRWPAVDPPRHICLEAGSRIT